MNPLLIFKTVGISVGLGSGITGSIFSSFQAFTKITIEEFFGTEWFDYTNNEEWKLLKKKLDDSIDTDEKKLKLTGLKEVKNATSDENGDKNKKWCKDKKTFKIKKLLPSSFDSLLLDYVKSFCLITIEEKLTTATTGPFTKLETDQTILKTNAQNLKNHVEGTNGNIDGIKELKEIKNSEGSDNKKEKALFEWCKSTYKKSYKNKDDNLWKLSEKYCKKNTE